MKKMIDSGERGVGRLKKNCKTIYKKQKELVF
jgi:hypothetical protein